MTGLVLYELRVYNPRTGRWLSRDPISESGGFNLYGFLENNVVNAVDAIGLQPLSSPPSELQGLSLVATGIDEIIEYLSVKVIPEEGRSELQWEAADIHTIYEGASKSPEQRESLLAHELIALMFGRQGIEEYIWSGRRGGFYNTKPFPGAAGGVYASGTHNLAMAFELATLAGLS
jgi:hypothetical protein